MLSNLYQRPLDRPTRFAACPMAEDDADEVYHSAGGHDEEEEDYDIGAGSSKKARKE